MGRAILTRSAKDVGERRSTVRTSAPTDSGAVLQAADEAGMRITQSLCGVIWQVRT